MNKFKKILLVCLTACCAVACALAAACSGSINWRAPSGGVTDNGTVDANNPEGNLPFYYPEGVNPEDYEDKENSYTISTVSMGGLPIDGVRITVKQEGEKIIEGISMNGGAKFLIPLAEYDLEYDDLPRGYFEDPEGTVKHLTPETTSVRTAFNSSVITTSAIPSGKQYDAGDIMYDFSITDADGNTLVLSQLLKQKRAVVINFWATWCSNCIYEFPALNGAYNTYKNSVEIIAVTKDDSNVAAKNFKEQSQLDFFMAHDNPGLFNHFSATSIGIPVSVIVDRYGVVAYYDSGAELRQQAWEELFRLYTADDYEQNIQSGSSGETGTRPDPVAPPETMEGMATDAAYNQAFLDSSMSGTDLHYYGPDPDSRDGKFNWPFHVSDENDAGGMYITPSNIGTDNTFAILYTDIELQADQTLSVEVKTNTDVNDILYIILNNNAATTFTFLGNSEGWETVELFSSTRHATVNIALSYVKDLSVAPDDEFVGLRNLKITDRNYNTAEANDVRTEAVTIENGEPVYPTVYKADDGFYRIQQGEEPNPETDSMLFADILSESLWVDRHFGETTLYYTDEGTQGVILPRSVYLISFWHEKFGNSGERTDRNAPLDFKYGRDETNTIIDNYYILDGTTYMAAVDETLATALKAFAKHANDNMTEYSGGYDPEHTWLELCSYYRTLGSGDHGAESHNCLAHFNPGVGKSLAYAIEMTAENQITVNLTVYTRKNQAGGLFYKFTAPEDGVYEFKSFRGIRPVDSSNAIDPQMLLWPAGSDTYNDTALLVANDSRSAERFVQDNYLYPYDFDAYIYLTKGTTVYPQFTIEAGNAVLQDINSLIDMGIDVTYPVEISYAGESKHVLTMAAIDGTWTSLTNFAAVDTKLDNDLYYHLTDEGVQGSVMYIEFLHSNYLAVDSNLKAWIDSNWFDFTSEGGGNFTSVMNGYYNQAISKDRNDPTYGMCEATAELVLRISDVIQRRSLDGDGIESGAWKGFAYYWQYYGATSWEELPQE